MSSKDGSGFGGFGGGIVKARLRGKLRLAGVRSTNPVVVGDRVVCSVEGLRNFEGLVTRSTGSWYEVLTEGGSSGGFGVGFGFGAGFGGVEVWIEEVLPRRNYIIRRASNLSHESHIIAANIDRALVVATLIEPVTAPEFIDRFLVTCEAYGIPAAIMLNKTDLAFASAGGREAIERFVEVYGGAGYRVMLASARGGEGMEEVREYLTGLRDGLGCSRGPVTLVAGNSGVGKSTLIGAVAPGARVKVGEVSRAHGKGMHTTTFSQMYALPGSDAGMGCDDGADADTDFGGGFIIDTPGIKGFGLVDIAPEELARYFPDLAKFSPDCQYYNCTHTHEPGCAVTKGVEDGLIAEERYVSYLKMLEEDGKYRK